MLAHILLLIIVASPIGPVPIAVKYPVESMEACEAFLADPAPILILGGRGVQITCVNEPTETGKPS